MLPESALAKAISAMLASLLMVEPELIWGLVIIIALNAVVSLWYTVVDDERTVGLVLRWLVTRIMVYVVTIMSVVVLSHMTGIDVLRQIAIAGVAGWEVAVSFALGARISPDFRPLYVQMVEVLDEHTPLEIDTTDIDRRIDRSPNDSRTNIDPSTNTPQTHDDS